jgi:tripartite-type tricarboxylate transporter receptor subunit TctC
VFNAAVADATVKTRLAGLGALAMMPNTPAQFSSFIADDAAKWAKVIKASGIKPE